MVARASIASAPLMMKAAFTFAVGSVGTGLFATVPGILLLYYMTQTLALPIALASLVVLVPKLAVVAIDPLIGLWSDRTRTRWGRRRPFLLVGAIFNAAAFIALFSVPSLGHHGLTALLLGALYFLMSSAYSLFAVPYIAMPSELTSDRAEQSKLIGFRMVFVFVGVLGGASFAPALVDLFGGDAQAYRLMALILATISAASMLCTAIFAPQSSAPHASSAKELPRTTQLIAITKTPAFSVGVLAYVIAMIGAATASAAAPYYVTMVLGQPESVIGLLFLTQVGISLCALLPWSWLLPRLGAGKALGFACLCTGLASILFAMLNAESGTIAFVAFAALNGIGAGGVQVSAFALLAQITGQLNLRFDSRLEGAIAGLWSAAEKLALAVGPAICGLALAHGNYLSGMPPHAQPSSALSATVLAMSVLPATLSILGGVIAFAGLNFWRDASAERNYASSLS